MTANTSPMPVPAPLRVATDVGGTYTDLVTFEIDEATGESVIRTAKSDTTPPDFEKGVLNVMQAAEVDAAAIGFLVHGTTVVINALTERTGAKVGLIATEGFRDTLEIARGNRPDFFNLHYRKPPPFVPRYLRRELPGRVSYRGEEMASPRPLAVAGHRGRLPSGRGVRGRDLLLHAYADPAHEQAALAELKRLWPGVSAVSSHQITREWREYERTSTTVLSAYVQNTAERYLKRLDGGLKERGFAGSLYVMQSNCGVDSVDAVARTPITMVESGPASGVWGAAELGRLIGEPNVLALDIGGTTAKCSLVENGQVRIMTDYWIERDQTSSGYPILVPVVDLVEIGNGGGSIAWVDDFGKLHVGPRSAGAVPGPAAYGRGGAEATTTDANLWLGRINPDYFRGGEAAADMEAAGRALGAVGARLGAGPDEAARGIVRIANNNMVNALKLVSVNRGFDPRDFTLAAFGGGGGMHAAALARELGVRRVVVPAGASVFSAWGMMTSDLRRDYFVTRLADLEPGRAGEIEAVFAETEARARERFAAEGGRGAAGGVLPLRQVPLSEPGAYDRGEARSGSGDRGSHRRDRGRLPRDLRARIHLPAGCAGRDGGHPPGGLGRGRQADHDGTAAGIGRGQGRCRARAQGPAQGGLCPRGGPPGRDLRRRAAGVGHGLRGAGSGRGPLQHGGRPSWRPRVGGRLPQPARRGGRLPGGSRDRSPRPIGRLNRGERIMTATETGTAAAAATAMDAGAGSADGSEAVNDPLADPITLEIIQNSLQTAADEMFAAMRKTAMSSIIYEVLDMGTGIMDAEGEIACSGAGIPAFIGVLDKAVKVLAAKFGRPGEIEPGDVFTTNDPYHGGVTHLNDVVVAMPVFAAGRIIAWTANIAHNSDVGGMAPGSLTGEATEIFQEGLRLPAIKIISRGEPIRSVMDVIKVNSRMPDVVEGDVWAAIASVRIGAKRLVEIADTYGAAAFERAMATFMDYGEQVSRAELAKLPKGFFALSEEQDDGQVYNVKITITDDEFVVDLRDNPDQAASPVNTSRDGVMVMAQGIFKSLTEPDSPCNAGSFRPIRLLTREGSVFHAKEPAPLGFYYEIELRVYDLMWRCLAPHVPERLAAGHFASVCGTFIGGTHPDTGRAYTIIEPQLGGWGARRGADGNNAMFSSLHGETFNCPAEVNEARNGLYVDRMASTVSRAAKGSSPAGAGSSWTTGCGRRTAF